MSTFNNIGIDSKLDWQRIEKMFRIGLFAGLLATMKIAKKNIKESR